MLHSCLPVFCHCLGQRVFSYAMLPGKGCFVRMGNYCCETWSQFKSVFEELLIEAHLVFSAPALNLIVALFQPGRSHLLPIRSGNVAVTDLPEQGHLVTCSLSKNSIQLTCQDNGRGLHDEGVQHIPHSSGYLPDQAGTPGLVLWAKADA